MSDIDAFTAQLTAVTQQMSGIQTSLQTLCGEVGNLQGSVKGVAKNFDRYAESNDRTIADLRRCHEDLRTVVTYIQTAGSPEAQEALRRVGTLEGTLETLKIGNAEKSGAERERIGWKEAIFSKTTAVIAVTVGLMEVFNQLPAIIALFRGG